MPRLSWHEMIRVFPGGHLVVGYIPLQENAVRMARTMQHLIVHLRPAKAWSASSRQQPHGLAVYCLFEDKRDADRLAEFVQAQNMSRYPGWVTQRCFDLDGRMVETITSVLAQSDEVNWPKG
jgi:hypothetical protein